MNFVSEKNQTPRQVTAREAVSRSRPFEGETWVVDAFSGADVADIAHILTIVHGSLPTVFELASAHAPSGHLRELLFAASESFQAWRRFLALLTSKAGPAPSCLNDDVHMVSLVQLKHAIQLLASSERRGCAVGAATAMLADWHLTIPPLLSCASRFGIGHHLPSPPQVNEIIAGIEQTEPTTSELRAMTFGASQFYHMDDEIFLHLRARRQARHALSHV